VKPTISSGTPPLSPAEIERRRQLVGLAQASPWLPSALRAVRGLGLASWCIGAGTIRNLVWDALHGHASPTPLKDVDVAYFDATDLSDERDRELQGRLAATLPGLPWEVTNQAAVHLWYERHFGNPVHPLTSLEEGLSTWPEFATCVGLWLRADDGLEVIAPHGLEDLFALTVRRNSVRVSPETYRQRIAEKDYQTKWPQVIVLSC
jgi:hypothetical protein